MLILPLIENAFKHGADSTIDASFIDAYLYSDSQLLRFICKNSYKTNNNAEVGGIGLVNIRKRLQLLYPNNHHFEITKTTDTFQILLEIKF